MMPWRPSKIWKMMRAFPLQAAACTVPLLALTACGMAHDTAASAPAIDARAPIRLAAADRDHLRAAMRGYLESIQGVLDAVNQRRMDRLAESARRSGMASLRSVSIATAASLPPGFTLLSLDTHEKFDALARLADQSASKKELLDQTSSILANCQACHAMFRLNER